MPLNPDDLVELVDALRDDAALSATLDPADVNLPGVLVRLDAVSEETFGGGTTLKVSCLLCVPDVGVQEALVQLGALYGSALPTLQKFGGPAAEATLATVQLPAAGGAVVPVLVVPLELSTIN
jgi:hypothetical protein